MLPKRGNACCRSRTHFVVKTGLDALSLGFSQQPFPLHIDSTLMALREFTWEQVLYRVPSWETWLPVRRTDAKGKGSGSERRPGCLGPRAPW